MDCESQLGHFKEGLQNLPNYDYCDDQICEQTTSLVEFLKDNQMFPTEENLIARIKSLEQFRSLIDRYALDFRKKLDDSNPEVAVFPIGSYRLGTFNDSSDIDLNILSTGHFERADFFRDFPDYLKGFDNIKIFRILTHTQAPTIKVYIDNIKMDAAFSSLTELDPLPSYDYLINSNDYVNSLDERTLRTFNSWRDVEYLLKIIPDLNKFRLVVRAIKLWVERRCVKSNMCGYLSSISWVFLVTKICLDSPKDYTPTQLLSQFFKTYADWDWSKPIRINRDNQDVCKPSSIFWMRDEDCPMIILTPSSPPRNDSAAVNNITIQILKREFERGKQIMGAMQASNSKNWSTLFEYLDFFPRYDIFAAILAENCDDWIGVVGSKLRRFAWLLSANMYAEKVHFLTNRFKSKRLLWLDESKYKRIQPEPDIIWLVGIKLVDSFSADDFFFNLEPYSQYLENASFNLATLTLPSEDYRLQARILKKHELMQYLNVEELKVYGYDQVEAERKIEEEVCKKANQTFVPIDWASLINEKDEEENDYTSSTDDYRDTDVLDWPNTDWEKMQSEEETKTEKRHLDEYQQKNKRMTQHCDWD